VRSSEGKRSPQATRMAVDTGGSARPATAPSAINAAPGAWASDRPTMAASAPG